MIQAEYPLLDWLEVIRDAVKPGATEAQGKAALRRLRVIVELEAGNIPVGTVYTFVDLIRTHDRRRGNYLKGYVRIASEAYEEGDLVTAFRWIQEAIACVESTLPELNIPIDLWRPAS